MLIRTLDLVVLELRTPIVLFSTPTELSAWDGPYGRYVHILNKIRCSDILLKCCYLDIVVVNN
jgi:hypothetical protein